VKPVYNLEFLLSDQSQRGEGYYDTSPVSHLTQILSPHILVHYTVLCDTLVGNFS
jgi:hypothetical protein